ncbi:MAG: LysM peptidoglycan-binding domain-containing protein [Bacteroidota bacterium]
MIKKHKLNLIVFILFSSLKVCAQNDTLFPSWINTSYNFIYFGDSSYLKNTVRLLGKKNEKFTILHIGDSHLQNENLPNQSRKLFQSIQGDAGIGLIVPFSTVKSYDARFYKSTHSGVWHCAKSYLGKFDYPMGVRGMTSYTEDSNATFKISFFQKVSYANNELIVFRHASDSVFDMSFMVDDSLAILKYADEKCAVYNVKGGFSILSFKVVKNNSLQKDLIITGLVLQDSLHRGGTWHNAGVGAAPYRMVLSEAYYEDEAKFLNPDLVIVDLGTNDFLYYNRIEPSLRGQIIEVIEKVKKANPSADIILTDAQEMRYKGKRTTVASDFSEMMYSLANEFHCGFWSYYHVSGQKNAWQFWDAAKFTQGDGIHLNGKGSELKGTLMFQAITNSVTLIRDAKCKSKILESDKDTLTWNDSLVMGSNIAISDSVFTSKLKPEVHAKFNDKQNKKSTSLSATYLVKKGDTLGAIAMKTKVPIAKIKKLNHLQSDKIKIGQRLKLK